ncbi:MAG: transcriptional regulator [Solobacterium sp.]|nr:transcriptional regulator [Solobacterium sp.]
MKEKDINKEKTYDGSLLSLYFHVTRKLHSRNHGSYAQQRILRILEGQEEVTQKELQDMLQIQAGSLSETILKLEKKGYIVRQKSEHDRRKKVVRITEEGKTANRKYRDTKDEIAFSALTKEERRQLQNLLLKVYTEEEEKDEIDI